MCRMDKWVNRVVKGDCLEVMPALPDRCVDMILCDLPYGETRNPWDHCMDLNKLWEQYKRIISPVGVIALTGFGMFTAKLILSNPEWFRYKIIWLKSKATNFLNAKKQPLRKHEDICIFYKKQPVYNPQMVLGEPYSKGLRKDQFTGSYGNFKPVLVKNVAGKRYPSDVIYFKTAEAEGPVWHPNQKPVALGRYLIKTFTKTGAVVLDNTCGAGSFLVAAVFENRKFIGIEKNEHAYLYKTKPIDFIGIAQERIQKAKTEIQSQLIN